MQTQRQTKSSHTPKRTSGLLSEVVRLSVDFERFDASLEGFDGAGFPANDADDGVFRRRAAIRHATHVKRSVQRDLGVTAFRSTADGTVRVQF